MNIKITYYDLSGEEFEALMKHEKIEKVDVMTDSNPLVEKWLKEKSINGYAVSLAYDLFCKDNPSANLSLIKFNKAVKATGVYFTKNVRIADSIQYCFVKYDGRDL